MGWSLTYDWWTQNKPSMLGRTGMGTALKAYTSAEKSFHATLVDARVTEPRTFIAYQTAWTALEHVEECRLIAVGQEKLAHIGFAPLLKPQVIVTRQHRLRDGMFDFVANGQGGINHIMDLSRHCQDRIGTQASMVSRFERAQMAAAQCRIPAAMRRLRDLRADITMAMEDGTMAPEVVAEQAGQLHRRLKPLPGDFSVHLKALAMLHTAGLRLTHQKKPIWDWLKRADAVLNEV
ncbi:MAG: hypothetical protein AAGF79_07010 [Pseudomonadota bacterium]